MILGLFKEKLNVNDHKQVVNYIISEEANQQWIYHVLENNFNKEAFRGLPFAKKVLNSFVTINLNMKARKLSVLLLIWDIENVGVARYL